MFSCVVDSILTFFAAGEQILGVQQKLKSFEIMFALLTQYQVQQVISLANLQRENRWDLKISQKVLGLVL